MARQVEGGPASPGQPGPTLQPTAPSLTPYPLTGRRARSLPTDWLPLALLAGDLVIAGASVLLVHWYHTRIDFLYRKESLPFQPYLAAVPAVALIYVFALALNHQYSSWRGRTLLDRLLGLYSGIGLASVLILAAISLTNLGVLYSRLTVFYLALATAVLMTAERYVLRDYETSLRRRGIGTIRLLMVGTGAAGGLLIRRMSMFPQYGYQVCGVVDDPGANAEDSFAGVPLVGRIDDLPRLVRRLRVTEVFIALPSGRQDRLAHLIKLCEDLNLEFRIVPDLLEVMSTRVEASAIDGLPVIGVRRNRLQGAGAVLKRALDLAVSALGLVVLSPLLGLVALLVKLTMPGPVFFRQERIGRQGGPFDVLKFRSMIVDAESETGPAVARPGDPRVTRLGRVLRKLSLDELPQLVNVLRGDMSLIGPRPQPAYFDRLYATEVPRYRERRRVRPGLTGWAEVNDLRGAAPIVDRTLYDLYYIENWSLKLDLKILILTGLRMFFQRHAY